MCRLDKLNLLSVLQNYDKRLEDVSGKILAPALSGRPTKASALEEALRAKEEALGAKRYTGQYYSSSNMVGPQLSRRGIHLRGRR